MDQREVDHGEFSRLLSDAQTGDAEAASALFPLVYSTLRDLARNQLARERQNHTLQPTALVHEAFMKLAGRTLTPFEGQAHFLNAAADTMRLILIDHARTRGRAKRGGEVKITSLVDCDIAIHADSEQILIIDDVICRLSEQDPAAAQIVRMRFYAGLSLEEIAAALGVSVSTIQREWVFARAFLFRELTDHPS